LEKNKNLSAGLDEVGMGCLAGPLCVAVLAFPKGLSPIPGVADSKSLSEKRREELVVPILEAARFIGIGWALPQTIDELGIAGAWQMAARDAVAGLPPRAKLIIDGVRTINGYEGDQRAVEKADVWHWQVSAASIFAKVIRDNDITEMAEQYPAYGWEKNKGYGTKPHRKQILLAGPCPYHRMSFLKKLLKARTY